MVDALGGLGTSGIPGRSSVTACGTEGAVLGPLDTRCLPACGPDLFLDGEWLTRTVVKCTRHAAGVRWVSDGRDFDPRLQDREFPCLIADPRRVAEGPERRSLVLASVRCVRVRPSSGKDGDAIQCALLSQWPTSDGEAAKGHSGYLASHSQFIPMRPACCHVAPHESPSSLRQPTSMEWQGGQVWAAAVGHAESGASFCPPCWLWRGVGSSMNPYCDAEASRRLLSTQVLTSLLVPLFDMFLTQP